MWFNSRGNRKPGGRFLKKRRSALSLQCERRYVREEGREGGQKPGMGRPDDPRKMTKSKAPTTRQGQKQGIEFRTRPSILKPKVSVLLTVAGQSTEARSRFALTPWGVGGEMTPRPSSQIRN